MKALADGHSATMKIVGPQLNSPFQDGIQLHGLALWRHLAGKAEQILDNLFCALRFLQDDAQVLARTLRLFGVLHQEVGKT